MSKDKTKKLVGQPIMNQILRLIPKSKIADIAKDTQCDRYYKKIPLMKHLTTMLFGVLSRCNSIREICAGMLLCEGKLNHIGLEKVIPKSTFADANKDRSSEVFERLYYSLVETYSSVLSDSRIIGLSIKQLFAVDSTTIRLFSDILKGVGRNPKGDGKKKGGVKAHMLIDAKEGIAKFVRITAAKVHDSTFLKFIDLPKNSFIVFDKAYNKYKVFAEWTSRKLYFVTRMKDNAVYKVVKVIQENDVQTGVIREEKIKLEYKDGKYVKTVTLRRITFVDDENRLFVFITNNLKISAEEVALIYKNRWQIELLFKKLKHNFQLRYFIGDSENAIKIQIWVTLIAHLLLSIIKKKANIRFAFSNIATIIRLHLMSYVDLIEFLKKPMFAWRVSNPVPIYQFKLF
ncbi:MAG: IS4 family transposase [Bacteroidales bacterium]